MACFYPWSVNGPGHTRPFSCGQCHGCLLERSRQWAVRIMHESSLHDENSFITLTFRDAIWSLNHKYWQDFMKRLRERPAFKGRRISFFMSGEYGETNSRAHFHGLLFNCGFRDLVYLRTTKAGSKLYRSALLESLWPHGFSSVGVVNFESAAYVARYAMKKISWKGDDLHEILDPDTGELFCRTPEYCRMSLNPAIGKEWIRKFKSDVFPHGKVVVNGRQARAPRYYDKFLRATDAGGYMELCHERAKAAGVALAESSPSRLDAREKVSVARLGLSRKKL